MPIYAYRCSACGHAQDVLQKMSDPVLTVCAACGAPALQKQLTAAGFQLKGSGWYVTDFRGGNSGGKKAEDGSDKPGDAAADKPAGDKPAGDKPDGDKPADKAAEKGADKAPEKKAEKKAEKGADKPVAASPAPAAASPAPTPPSKA